MAALNERGRNARTAAATVAVLAALIVCGCAGRSDPRTRPSPRAPSPWPTSADYTTISTARTAMLDLLLRETDWRRRSYGARFAMQTLLTVRVAPGRCAIYVGRLYSELWSLSEGYEGEDWRPLVRLVRDDPTVRTACQPPSGRALSANATA
jgi:hypothetical protein